MMNNLCGKLRLNSFSSHWNITTRVMTLTETSSTTHSSRYGDQKNHARGDGIVFSKQARRYGPLIKRSWEANVGNKRYTLFKDILHGIIFS